jgi:hypothetical protein
MLRPEPMSNARVGNVRRGGPFDINDLEAQLSSDCLTIALVVHGIRRGERAVNIEEDESTHDHLFLSA